VIGDFSELKHPIFDGLPKTLLVGGFNPSEKYESQLGLLFPIYGKKMFETTN